MSAERRAFARVVEPNPATILSARGQCTRMTRQLALQLHVAWLHDEPLFLLSYSQSWSTSSWFA